MTVNSNKLDFSPTLEIAREAGKIIMGYYNSILSVEVKDDKSPVTRADIEANSFIVDNLENYFPDIPIIAEESYVYGGPYAKDMKGKTFFLVDPLDGTKSFIRGTGEFTVNIGLIEDGLAVAGVIYVPARQVLYYTGNDGKAYRSNGKAEQISVRDPADDGLDAVVSHSHYDPRTEDFLKQFKIRNKKSGSSSVKLCMVAAGEADVYPRFGRTMEWDTAAGHGILKAAGGNVTTVDGKELTYGKTGFENPDFIAWGKR